MNDWAAQQAEQEFNRAWAGAIGAMVLGWFRRRPSSLIPLDEVRTRLLFQGQRDRGIETVPIDNIVGSEGRWHEFDRRFRPRYAKLAPRWMRIRSAYVGQQGLPAVELIKIGEIYFVRDGNHRVSVARQRGQQEIDAHVIELQTNVPVPASLDRPELERKAAQSRFVDDIGFVKLRPGAAIPLQASDAATYEALRRHISGHRYFMGLDLGRPVDYAEAVGHWYDAVYLPQIEAMRRLHTEVSFPGRTETNVFMSIIEHRFYLAERSGSDPDPDAAAIDYMARYGPWRTQLRSSSLAMLRVRLRAALRRARDTLLALPRRARRRAV